MDFYFLIVSFNKIFFYYLNTYAIKETKNEHGVSFYFKKTENAIAVPSLVMDISNFISVIVSISDINFEVEKLAKEKFTSAASEYFHAMNYRGRLITNEYLDKQKQIRVNAIFEKNGQLTIVNCVTGSTYHYFRNSISKTNILFEMADKTKEKEHLKRKIALIDDSAGGYQIDRISYWLGHLASKAERVNWSNKEQLNELILS